MRMAESRAAEGLRDGPAPRRQGWSLRGPSVSGSYFLSFLRSHYTSQIWHAVSSILESSEGSEQETLSIPKKFLA